MGLIHGLQGLDCRVLQPLLHLTAVGPLPWRGR